MQAIKDLGHEVIPVDTEPKDVVNKQQRFGFRVRKKLFGPLDLGKANQSIIRLLKEHNVDVLWLDKALTIRPETLNVVRRVYPKVTIVGYSPDDMMAKYSQSQNFLKGISLYDIFFTTKSFNVNELQKLGCAKTVFIGNAYDPILHRPMVVTDEDRLKFGGPVGFIGAYERERAEAIFYLAENSSPVRVWGPNWDTKYKLRHPNVKIEGGPLWGKDYTRAINSFDIVLCFLRKISRDLQTTRSVEIPACGRFMVAERTEEHLQLFEEGKEAEFFSSNKELLDKVSYYLAHPEERKRIAVAGRERCLKNGYSNHDRLKWMLEKVISL